MPKAIVLRGSSVELADGLGLAVGVVVAVLLELAVGEAVNVLVDRLVAVAVGRTVGVFVDVAVLPGRRVAVGSGAGVRVAVGVLDAVGFAVLEGVAVGGADGFAVAVLVGLMVGLTVGEGPGPSSSTTSGITASTWLWSEGITLAPYTGTLFLPFTVFVVWSGPTPIRQDFTAMPLLTQM